jgi:predicted glutamine amidotransferase
MKAHQITLEQLSGRVPLQARGRLVVMYDKALSELTEKKIRTVAAANEPFVMNVSHSEVVISGTKLTAVRILDVDTGVFVRLAKTDKDPDVMLEVGAIFATEELSHNIRVW